MCWHLWVNATELLNRFEKLDKCIPIISQGVFAECGFHVRQTPSLPK
ncbi:hypothetical protein PSTAB_2434 [Stutzerimonas stutzeri]|uniref:Uncharacterized protein n=1 Tax=Stutzerimonas stutzeri (strain ATCC 17588 / DSM 5190 / CCUG 11256 / JCM 5965 / LMG 11199 / NBRC 14165 / NCIMB 11358 / Stanier 221) TaxID=96563 RepID=F8H243_STUS2|nr:hypothetical protein PSTAB_2434 [Stutzerimonas stutzeri]